MSKTEKTQAARPNFFVRLGRWFKEKFSGMASELKKVTWPTFKEVVKKTGIVLAVVIIFALILLLIDYLLGLLFGLL